MNEPVARRVRAQWRLLHLGIARAMAHSIPIFQEISEGKGCFRFPGYFSSDDASRLERIHKELRAAASHHPDQFEQLVCNAVQQCYDLLKEAYLEGGGNLNKYVLEDALPTEAFEIAIEVGWLPEAARTDAQPWRDWIKRLLAGRFSRVGIDWHPSGPDPYLFVPFPQSAPARTESERLPDRAQPGGQDSTQGTGVGAEEGSQFHLPAFPPPARARVDAAIGEAHLRCNDALHRAFAGAFPADSPFGYGLNDIDPCGFFGPIVDWAEAVYDAYAEVVVTTVGADPRTIQGILHWAVPTHLHDLLIPYRTRRLKPGEISWDQQPPNWTMILFSNAWNSFEHPAKGVLGLRMKAMIESVDDSDPRNEYCGRQLWDSLFPRFLRREQYWVVQALKLVATGEGVDRRGSIEQPAAGESTTARVDGIGPNTVGAGSRAEAERTEGQARPVGGMEGSSDRCDAAMKQVSDAPPRRRPDVETSRRRLELADALARELATLKGDLDRYCNAEGLRNKYPEFALWQHINTGQLKELIDGAEFTPRAYAENLALHAFGNTSRETLRKDRKKLRKQSERVRLT